MSIILQCDVRLITGLWPLVLSSTALAVSIVDVTIRLDNAENQSSGWLLRKPTVRAKCVEVGTRINMTQCVNDHPFVEPSVW